jgi:predicted transcriptional regulator
MSFPQSIESPALARAARAARAGSGERTSPVAHGRVKHACSKGIFACSSFAGLAEMGRLMTTHQIHSLIVWQAGGARWGVVSDVDIAFAALSAPDAVADDLASPAPSIADEASLSSAIKLMRERRTSHLVVIDSASDRPIGVLSALDIAGIVGWAAA